MNIHRDTTETLDKGSVVALVLLDLPAAFDLVNHAVVLKEKALSWMKSYLSDRIPCISVSGKSQSDVNLHFGVPQGSVLGAKKYTKPVCEINKYHINIYFCYADGP